MRIGRIDLKKNGIVKDLLNSQLSLFVGGGALSFNMLDLEEKFHLYDDINALGKSKEERVGHFISKKDVPSVDLRGNILSLATSKGIQYLNNKQKTLFSHGRGELKLIGMVIQINFPKLSRK